MTEHRISTQEEWQAERDELLKEEKELTRRGDELARKRRELPWVPVEKDYRFETEDGTKTLAELFDGRSQLLVDRGHARPPGAPREGQGHHPAGGAPGGRACPRSRSRPGSLPRRPART